MRLGVPGGIEYPTGRARNVCPIKARPVTVGILQRESCGCIYPRKGESCRDVYIL